MRKTENGRSGALDRSETRRDGGYKHNWSFSFSGDSEEKRRHDETFPTAVFIISCFTCCCFSLANKKNCE
uniref:Uncharacterized protein n=1 Tax=Monopterus albus TaxID=43700 RepID=A0A3Q3JJU1_MONAL